MQEYRRYIVPHLRSSWDGLGARLVALLPGALVNFLGLLYFRALGPRYLQPLVDLRSSRYYFKRWFTVRR